MLRKSLSKAILIVVALAASMRGETTLLAIDQGTWQTMHTRIVLTETSTTPLICVAPTESLLATITQNANNNRAIPSSPRVWGRLFKFGAICIFLVGAGVVWLFNKLKPK